MKTELVKVNPDRPDPGVIADAVRILKNDGLVVMPTETVYGLAARALSPDAVRRVFAAKGRQLFEPLPVQVAVPEMLLLIGIDVTGAVRRLVERFMPGPLTLVLPAAGVLPDIVTGGSGTVGVRIPNHPVALAVLQAVSEPLVVTSANLSGQPAPKDAQAAMRQLEGRTDLVLDAGPSALGRESTVLDMTALPPKILREGTITRGEIEAALGSALAS
jgi:L-threonylcarbamoyladenylate synthase